MRGPPRPSRALLEQIFHGALDGASPTRAVQRALAALPIEGDPWIRILAIGKAAVPMANAAAEALAGRGLRVRDGLVVPPHPATPLDPALTVVPGDHPLPGSRSRRAADAVGRFVEDGRTGDFVLVLLSGGTSSLIGAPVATLPTADWDALQAHLLESGLPIGVVNRIRRRAARWGAGRLAAALAPARVEVLAIADVPGDHVADIGSGPCSADPDRAGNLKAYLGEAGLWHGLPTGFHRLIDATIAGRVDETPAATDPRLAGVTTRVIASNGDAIAGALQAAKDLGLRPVQGGTPLTGEAAAMGRLVAEQLLATDPGPHGTCVVWGGEPTVRLEPGTRGVGGRAQELALAAAEVLAGAGTVVPALLVAGTDGRDGPTPAAGAVVDQTSWRALAALGRDPAADLAGHDSHTALTAIGATLVTGPTGTNVMDLAIGIVHRSPGPTVRE